MQTTCYTQRYTQDAKHKTLDMRVLGSRKKGIIDDVRSILYVLYPVLSWVAKQLYLRGVAGCGAAILLENWLQLGQSRSADVWSDAIIVLNQNLLLLT